MKNKKIKLIGIENSDTCSYYTFEKKENFLDIVRELYKIFDFKEYSEDDFFKKGIKILKDKHYFRNEKDSRIDLFFGKNRVFLIIHSNFKLIGQFNRELEKISYMPNVK